MCRAEGWVIYCLLQVSCISSYSGAVCALLALQLPCWSCIRRAARKSQAASQGDSVLSPCCFLWSSSPFETLPAVQPRVPLQRVFILPESLSPFGECLSVCLCTLEMKSCTPQCWQPGSSCLPVFERQELFLKTTSCVFWS